MKTIEVDNLTQLPVAAKAIVEESVSGVCSVVAFYGEMGAGKTTLIREICTQLGVTDNVTSPTFAIINQYLRPDGGRVNHFDFYRIGRIEEAFDLGYEEYFYGGELCLVEWPEKIEALLPEKMLRVTITSAGEDKRQIIIM